MIFYAMDYGYMKCTGFYFTLVHGLMSEEKV